jgi:hypothetical protein
MKQKPIGPRLTLSRASFIAPIPVVILRERPWPCVLDATWATIGSFSSAVVRISKHIPC